MSESISSEPTKCLVNASRIMRAWETLRDFATIVIRRFIVGFNRIHKRGYFVFVIMTIFPRLKHVLAEVIAEMHKTKLSGTVSGVWYHLERDSNCQQLMEFRFQRQDSERDCSYITNTFSSYLKLGTFGLDKSVRKLSTRAAAQLHTCIRPRQKVRRSPGRQETASSLTMSYEG